MSNLSESKNKDEKLEQLLNELQKYKAYDVSISYEDPSSQMVTIYSESKLTCIYNQEVKQFQLIFDCIISQDGDESMK